MDAINSMRFFYLKLGKGNSLATEWLSGRNPLGKPAVVIFFGHRTIKDIGDDNSQVKDFYQCSLPEVRDNTVMVVVGDGKAWFLKPAGEIIESEPPPNATQSLDSLWKIMPVEILLSGPLELKDVPPILAGINANAYLSRGTYREITHWGNIKAIYSVLQKPLPRKQLQDENCSAARLLECLSSIELETLVAKLFEAAGCFVPAYRGGCVRDIDLFVHNDRPDEIRLENLIIPAKGSLSVQIKGWTSLKECPEIIDCLIGFRVPKVPRCFDDEWLLRQVRSFSTVAQWCERSLNWLPEEFLAKYFFYPREVHRDYVNEIS
jgi:hypothetical protein